MYYFLFLWLKIHDGMEILKLFFFFTFSFSTVLILNQVSFPAVISTSKKEGKLKAASEAIKLINHDGITSSSPEKKSSKLSETIAAIKEVKRTT